MRCPSVCASRFQERFAPIKNGADRFFPAAGNTLELASDGFAHLAQYGASLGEHILMVNKQPNSAQHFRSFSRGAAAARDAIDAVRFVTPVYQLVTGKIFFVRSSSGNYKVRGFMEIAVDTAVLVARLLSPVNWLHSVKAINLGDHSKRISGVIMGIWGFVVATIFAGEVHKLLFDKETNRNPKLMGKQVVAVAGAGIDLLALPFDCGVGSLHPALGITGAVLNILSSLKTIKEKAF